MPDDVVADDDDDDNDDDEEEFDVVRRNRLTRLLLLLLLFFRLNHCCRSTWWRRFKWPRWWCCRCWRWEGIISLIDVVESSKESSSYVESVRVNFRIDVGVVWFHNFIVAEFDDSNIDCNEDGCDGGGGGVGDDFELLFIILLMMMMKYVN